MLTCRSYHQQHWSWSLQSLGSIYSLFVIWISWMCFYLLLHLLFLRLILPVQVQKIVESVPSWHVSALNNLWPFSIFTVWKTSQTFWSLAPAHLLGRHWFWTTFVIHFEKWSTFHAWMPSPPQWPRDWLRPKWVWNNPNEPWKLVSFFSPEWPVCWGPRSELCLLTGCWRSVVERRKRNWSTSNRWRQKLSRDAERGVANHQDDTAPVIHHCSVCGRLMGCYSKWFIEKGATNLKPSWFTRVCFGDVSKQKC